MGFFFWGTSLPVAGVLAPWGAFAAFAKYETVTIVILAHPR